jgi:hypothetical protein
MTSVTTLTGIDQAQYNQIGVTMGQRAAQTSIHDSTIHNQTGVIAGQMAKNTSENDTYVH